MELEKEKIKKRFAEINEALGEIRRLAAKDEKEFWSKKENMAAVKYFLLQAIESTGSICVHIAAKKFNKGVSAFGECFEVLGEEKFLPEELVLRLRRMAKFRNKLIHQYWEVDDRSIIQYAKDDLDDFTDFMKAVGRII